jgi:predicted dehydrogenase
MPSSLSVPRIAVVGLGRMGQLYARILASHPYAHLVAVCDVDATAARTTAARVESRAYLDLRELLAHEPVDGVVVAVSDQHHLEPSLAAIEAGKHVFLEKPVATEIDEARRIASAAAAAGVRLLVGHTLRFDPRYALAQHAIARGEIGDVIHMYARRIMYRSDGRRLGGRTSLAFFLGVHDIDVVQWFAGCRVRSVYARGRRHLMADLGVDDTVFSVLAMENGVVASIENSWVLAETQGGRQAPMFEVVGSEGSIYINPFESGLSILREDRSRYPDVLYGADTNAAFFGVYRQEMEHFLDCVAGRSEPLVPVEAALAAVAVAKAVERSLAEGREIAIDWSAWTLR